MKWHTIGVTVYSFIVVYTGALVRHMNASLVCRDFPLCVNSDPSLPANRFEWVQMGHRTAALLIFVWIAYITFRAVRHYQNQRVIYWGWIIAFVLVCLQAISGAMVVFSRMNLTFTLLHAFFISCLFGLLCYLNLVVGRVKQFAKSKDSLPLKKPGFAEFGKTSGTTCCGCSAKQGSKGLTKDRRKKAQGIKPCAFLFYPLLSLCRAPVFKRYGLE